jgi:hypothetical protein
MFLVMIYADLVANYQTSIGGSVAKFANWAIGE